MTTNITPIEALEKCKKAIEFLINPTNPDEIDMDDKLLNLQETLSIINQALTSHSCDVTKCPAYEEHGGEYWQGCWEFNDICQEDGYHCSDKPNCNFKTKRLHSQQKTFTVDEIKEL